MEDRVLKLAGEHQVSTPEGQLLRAALRAAMQARENGSHALPSDQHPTFLHPGRTVLILLQDLDETDGSVLAAAALSESRDTSLRVAPAIARELLDEKGFSTWNSLPVVDWQGEAHGTGSDRGPENGDRELLEALVTADVPVAKVALAEALDHLRHAHLLTERNERVRAALLAERVYAPVAERVHPVLERRLNWWTRRVGSVLKEA
jgi:(p)ppGpp synthase/HD superfamily hydrolase